MKPEEAKEHIEQIRREKREKDSPDLRAALKLLAEELNTKETHFILELLQNAEDNEYANREPELRLAIEAGNPTDTPSADGCLVVLNNEVGFQLENVRSLCSVGKSTKEDRNRGYIGEKGIGFKSVFRVTDSPHIVSNGFQFRFQIPTESEGFGYILPHWVEAVPPVAQDGFTAILLPLQPGKREVIARRLSKIAPETVLFLAKLKRLHLGDGRSISCNGKKLVTLRCSGEDALYFVHSEQYEKPEGVTEGKRQGVTERQVTVALPLKSATPCAGRIFAFLPTEFDSGLPFLVNGDFLLNSNRERVLEDCPWNRWLRDEIAPTFVQAFLSVLNEPEWRVEAYWFLPIAADLTPGADFFAPIVESVQKRLQSEKCILTSGGNLVLPKQAHFADPLATRVLRDAPPERATVALLNPALESHWERLKQLEVQTLSFPQLFDACDDEAWLKSRDAEWWETLFELCTKCDVSARTIGSFPILRCRDGNCRPLSCGVFFHAENQPTPTGIPSDWPAAHILDADLQNRLQQKPAMWAWLTRVACLRPCSIESYITGSLLDWMRRQTGEQLIQATRFIAMNLKHLGEQSQSPDWRQRFSWSGIRHTLRDKVPWLLADGRVLLPEARGGTELITPECLEGDTGWNLLFPALERHFSVIHDAYCAGLSEASLVEMRKLFKACGATAFPGPLLREVNAGNAHYNAAFARCAKVVNGTPALRDWAAQGWLIGLASVGQIANGQRKIEALEKWLKAFGSDRVGKYLHCSKADYEDNWQEINAWSEFGVTLRTKPWLRTNKGYVAPPSAFLDTPEFREFFGDSVPYLAGDLSSLSQFLEKLGTRTRLTTEVLIGLLRQMSRTPEKPDLVLLDKIYRRLHDSVFDAGIFQRERLIFLLGPEPPWLSTDKLVWENEGDLFDDDFGYVSPTYGKSELHRFFTERLRIPDQPALRHYATAWKNLCSATAPDRTVVERKLNVVLQRLADYQNELSSSDWWHELMPHLRIWTDRGEFQPPARVYVPDHSIAVELFAGRIHVAFPPNPNPTVTGFLRWRDCRSLASAVQTRLAAAVGEFAPTAPAYLTPAAKELCVLLVCSHHGWQDRCSLLQALLETAEAGVRAITVEYSLSDNREAGTQLLTRDAHWDVANRRLLLRDGVDTESLRDAAAKGIAAQFFGEAASAEKQAEFFRLLTVSVERARKLMAERSNWRLTPGQREWLRQQNWQIIITELDAVEPSPVARVTRKSTTPPPYSTATKPTVPGTTQEQAEAQQTRARESDGPNPPGRAGVISDATKSPNTPKPQHGGGSQAIGTKQLEAMPVIVIRAQAKRSDSGIDRRKESRQPQSTSARAGQAGGLDSLSRAEKDELEERAIMKAIEVLKAPEQKWGTGFDEVEDVHKQNLGYDLLAKRKAGELLRVELKAHRGEVRKVNVTRKEWKEHMRQTPSDQWELWNVEFLDGAEVVVTRHNKIPSHALEPSAYWVDLNACSWGVD
jgi:hypothetical protein